MEINEIRDQIVSFHKLENLDDEYVFYYDETNNFRKLYLKEHGLSIPYADNFVLAGILRRKNCQNIDFESLLSKLNLQKSVKELKFKHIAQGKFINILNSKKLKLVFEWILENDLFIHYFNLNLLYWSITDIVDSIIEESNEPFYIYNHMSLKSDLYKVMMNDQLSFTNLLHHYDYPNIKPEKICSFSNSLSDFVTINIGALPDDRAYILQRFIEKPIAMDSLYYIQGMEERVLIDDFLVFYLRTLYIFKNSQHIFDSEKRIEKLIKRLPLEENGLEFINFNFVDSKDEIAVQVSDVIAGFLGKYFTFIKDTTINELIELKENMNPTQRLNVSLLRSVIDKSDDLSRGFFNKVASEDEFIKNNYFLHDVPIE